MLDYEILSYEDINKYYQEHSENMAKIINIIESDIIKARENDSVPIYMTRARVKDKDSFYLKTKRKGKTKLEDVTDLLGLRVLCLFEQDILAVYKFLLKMLSNDVYVLNEILIIGWKEESVVPLHFLENEYKKIKEKFEDVKFEYVKRTNGYQSIHFVGIYKDCHNNTQYTFEIQLRTLLQDVWGELEHKVAYKQKSAHKFIKQSFIRLSKHLETNDMLITHLKELIDDIQCGKESVPFSVNQILDYEKNRIPKIFTENKKVKKLYKKYKKKLQNKDILKDKKQMKQAEEMYKELCRKVNARDDNVSEDKKFKYWADMEKAFYKIYKGELEATIGIYKKYITEYKSYVSAFRLGQIYLYKEEYVEALKYFDKCFNLLENNDSLEINRVILYVNMALIFWNLGSEYLTASINFIDKALKKSSKLEDGKMEVLYNSACWYYMECFLNKRCSDKIKDSEEKALKYYKKLLKVVENSKGKIRKNTYDTLAWYNYNMYIKNNKKDKNFIKEAKKYVDLLRDEGVELSSTYYSHKEIHNNHIQKIICEYDKILS